MKAAEFSREFLVIMIGCMLVSGIMFPAGCSRDADAGAVARVVGDIPVPEGCERVPVSDASWCSWLRALPLKPAGSPVLLYNGARKQNQQAHHAVVDIGIVSRKNLQQCADAVMRLRAEYLFDKGFSESICFNATSGDALPYRRWLAGETFRSAGQRVAWNTGRRRDNTRETLHAYLEQVFVVAGTWSLERELVPATGAVQAGDVFIKGGFPGHAVLVADIACDRKNGELYFLLMQSYMPAQEVQVLRNPNPDARGPWYKGSDFEELVTPEWTFKPATRKRFK